MPQQNAEGIWSQGTLLDLDIGRSTFQKKLSKRDLRLDGVDDSNKAFQTGHKKILPANALLKLIEIESEARAFLETNSLKFPISGARFVSFRVLDRVTDRLGELKSEWDAAVEELIAKFPEYKAEQLKVLDDAARKIQVKELEGLTDGTLAKRAIELEEWYGQQKIENRALYPSTVELSKMFRFSWRMFRISASEGLETMTVIQQETLASAQQQIRTEMQSWVRQASVDLHRALGEAAANAVNLLKKQKKLNPRNLKPLFDAFEEFKSVDFTGQSDFREKIDELRKKFIFTDSAGNVNMDMTVAGINGTETAQETFNELLTEIGALAVEKVAEEAGIKALAKLGESGRLVEF